jgi:alpha-L-rhamnosidase
MRARVVVVVLQAATITVHALAAQPGSGAQLPRAFIWLLSAPSGRQAYVLLRKDFALTRSPGEATLPIFADARWILWTNDEYVLRGPCRFDPRRAE